MGVIDGPAPWAPHGQASLVVTLASLGSRGQSPPQQWRLRCPVPPSAGAFASPRLCRDGSHNLPGRTLEQATLLSSPGLGSCTIFFRWWAPLGSSCQQEGSYQGSRSVPVQACRAFPGPSESAFVHADAILPSSCRAQKAVT